MPDAHEEICRFFNRVLPIARQTGDKKDRKQQDGNQDCRPGSIVHLDHRISP
jgi:hypothetical protein